MSNRLAPPTAPRLMTTGVHTHASKPTITTGVRTRASKPVTAGAIGGSATQIGPTGSRGFNATSGAPQSAVDGVGTQRIVPAAATLEAILAAQNAPAAVANRARMRNAIRQLQAWLNAQGYHCPINGELDFATRGALSQWQADHHLPSTGSLDPATIATIEGGNPVAISAGAVFGQVGAGEAGSSSTEDHSPTTMRRTILRASTMTRPALAIGTLAPVTPHLPHGTPVVKVNPKAPPISPAQVPQAGTHFFPIMKVFRHPAAGTPPETGIGSAASGPGMSQQSATAQNAGPAMNPPSTTVGSNPGGAQALVLGTSTRPRFGGHPPRREGATMANKGSTKGWRSTGWRIALVLTATINAAASTTISVNPQMDFRGENLVIDSTTVGPSSTLTLPSVGTIPQIAGGSASTAVPGTLFSPAQAGALDFKMSIANQGNAVSFNANNTNTTVALAFAALLFGTEVEAGMDGMTTGVVPAGAYVGG